MTSKKDMMTIKELADSLNMPKNKINYQVSKLDTNYIVVLNGIKHLTKQGQMLILESLGIKEPFNTSEQLNTDLDSFKHLIKQQEEQLKSKDSQIEKLHTLLDQQQQLTLQSNKQIDKLQLQLETVTTTAEEKEEPEVEVAPIKESFDNQEQADQIRKELEQKNLENERLKQEVAELKEAPKKGFWQRLFNS